MGNWLNPYEWDNTPCGCYAWKDDNNGVYVNSDRGSGECASGNLPLYFNYSNVVLYSHTIQLL